MKSILRSFAVLCLSVGIDAQAQVTTWTGQTDLLWSTPENWSGNLPTGKVVSFRDDGKTTADVVGNRVTSALADLNGEVRISGLLYGNTYGSAGVPAGANYQVTEIESGIAVKVEGTSGDLLVVGTTGYASTFARVQGGGSLSVGEGGGTIRIGARLAGASLDLSGLNLLTTDVENIFVGIHQSQNVTIGSLILADRNEIRASTLAVGSRNANSTGVTGTLTLGRENEFLIDQIYVGKDSGAIGSINFAMPGGMLTISGKDQGGASRANMTVGFSDGALGNEANRITAVSGTVDFTGGSVDAYLDTLTIGKRNFAGEAEGIFRMDEGSIDALHTVIGEQSAGSASGTLEIKGGEFTTRHLVLAKGSANAAAVLEVDGDAAVTVVHDALIAGSGGVVMGDGVGADSSATLRLNGGSITVQGDISKGGGSGVNATIELLGGKLDLNGHEINVDVFRLESGYLANLGEFNEGAAVVKSGSGTLHLEGEHRYRGATVVQSGTLQLSGSLANGSVSVSDGATMLLRSGSRLQMNLRAMDDSDLFAVEEGGAASFSGEVTFFFEELLGEGSWNLFTGLSGDDFLELEAIFLSGSYTGGLTMDSFGVWQGIANGMNFSFDQNHGTLTAVAIPEPGSWLLLSFGGIACWGLRRKGALTGV